MEDEEEATTTTTTTTGDLGVSHYDHVFHTWRCCYCGEPVALNVESEQLLIEQQYNEWQRANLTISPSKAREIAQRVHEREQGHQFSRTQYIHSRCLSELLRPANNDKLAAIRARGEFVLPSDVTHRMYPINYARYASRPCDYCGRQVDSRAPGTGYRLYSDSNGPILYIHFACFTCLASKRANSHGVPPFAAAIAAPADDDPATVAHTDAAWSAFMARGPVSDDALLAYHDWREQREKTREGWSEKQGLDWQAALGEDNVLLQAEGDIERAKPQPPQQIESALIQAQQDAMYPLRSDDLRLITVKLNVLHALYGRNSSSNSSTNNSNNIQGRMANQDG